MATNCPFCEIAAGRAPATIVMRWLVETAEDSADGELLEVIAFPPLSPVTPKHLLVVPSRHVEHAATDPQVSAATMACAAEFAATAGDFKIITSAGPAATQSVAHLHLHIVPRRPDDGLALPWSP